MAEQQPISAPLSENLRRPEGESRITDRPAVAHVAMLAVENSFANPDIRVITDEQKARWVNAKPEDLSKATKAASEVSWESRAEAYKNDTRRFDEQNKEWNNAFWNAVQDTLNDQSVDSAVLGQRRMAYEALGLDINTTDQDANGLYIQVEAFRKKYVSEKKGESDISVFINDIAIGCKDANDIVDLQKLEERLQAIQPMLGIFGTDKNAGELVADFAMAHAMTGQKDEAKKAIADHLQIQIQRQPKPVEHVRLKALHEKLGGGQIESSEKGERNKQKSLARNFLERELSEIEEAIIDKGGDARRVIQAAHEHAIHNIATVVPLTTEQARSKNTPHEDTMAALAAFYSPKELSWALQYIGMPDSQRRDILTRLRKKADLIRQHGGDPIYVIQARQDDEKPIQFISEVSIIDNGKITNAEEVMEKINSLMDTEDEQQESQANENAVMSELTRKAWETLVAEQPFFADVRVENLPDDLEANPAVGAKYSHPQTEGETAVIYLRKDNGPIIKYLHEVAPAVIEIVSNKLGVEPVALSDDVLSAYFALHEAGHAFDYKGMTFDAVQAKRKADIDTLPARNLADFRDKYPQATKEQIDDFVRRYRSTVTETAADDFAANFMKSHPELFPVLAKTAEQTPTVFFFNEKYNDSSGATYEVVSTGGDLPLALRKNDGTLLIGEEAANILKSGKKVEERPEEPNDQVENTGQSTQEEIQQSFDAFGQIINGFGEKEAKRAEHRAQLENALGRDLRNAEKNVIGHGATYEETLAIINHNLEQHAADALEQAQRTGQRNLTLNGDHELLHTLQSLNLQFDNDQINKELAKAKAALRKAAELKVTAAYELTLKKNDQGAIVPEVAFTVLQYPRAGGEVELSRTGKNELYAQILAASDAETGEPAVELNNDPLTEDELGFALEYMTYSEVNNDPEGSTRWLAEHPHARMYVRELKEIFDEYGKDFVLTKAEEKVQQLQAKLQELQIPGTEYSKSRTWYLWHISKERLLAKNKELQSSMPNASQYEPFDPLLQYGKDVNQSNAERSTKAENDILYTQLGWEAYEYNKQHPNVLADTVNGNAPAEEKALLRIYLNDVPKEENQSLPSYKLKQIGETLMRYDRE